MKIDSAEIVKDLVMMDKLLKNYVAVNNSLTSTTTTTTIHLCYTTYSICQYHLEPVNE